VIELIKIKRRDIMGITETRKLITMLKSDIVGLLSIDYQVVGEELSELDLEEKKELLILRP